MLAWQLISARLANLVVNPGLRVRISPAVAHVLLPVAATVCCVLINSVWHCSYGHLGPVISAVHSCFRQPILFVVADVGHVHVTISLSAATCSAPTRLSPLRTRAHAPVGNQLVFFAAGAVTLRTASGQPSSDSGLPTLFTTNKGQVPPHHHV